MGHAELFDCVCAELTPLSHPRGLFRQTISTSTSKLSSELDNSVVGQQSPQVKMHHNQPSCLYYIWLGNVSRVCYCSVLKFVQSIIGVVKHCIVGSGVMRCDVEVRSLL